MIFPNLEMHLAKKHNLKLLKLVHDDSPLCINYIHKKELNGLRDTISGQTYFGISEKF